MRLSDFRRIIKNELQYGNKKVAYMCTIDGEVNGGMCSDEKEALIKCKDILNGLNLKKNNNYEFNVVVYDNDVKLLDTYDVLNKIKREL